MATIFQRFSIWFNGSKLRPITWVFIGFGAISVSYLAWVLYLTNQFGYYSPASLYKGVVFIPLLFGFFYLIIRYLYLPHLHRFSPQRWGGTFMVSIFLLIIFINFIPVPIPALIVNHEMKIIGSDNQNSLSSGNKIEIIKIRSADGRGIDWQKINKSGDWTEDNGVLISNGRNKPSLQYIGPVSGGLVVTFKYDSNMGIVAISVDGISNSLDLYNTSPSLVNDIVIKNNFREFGFLQKLGWIGAYFFYISGMFLLILGFVIALNIIKPIHLSYFMGTIMFAVFILFLLGKLDYFSFLLSRTYRDTLSYVQNSNQPFFSTAFWAGNRAPIFPMLLKIFGSTPKNYQASIFTSKIFHIQSIISIIAWSALALILAWNVNNRWLKITVFSLTIFFSLTLEIGLWDSLLLTESLTFSLFAILLAAWIVFWKLPEKAWHAIWGWLYLVFLLFISGSFIFVRDSNLFFVAIGVVIFCLIVWLKDKYKFLRIPILIYGVLTLALCALYPISVTIGNRWQVFIYDNLAMRVLPNADMRNYFAANGLPITEEVLSTTKMLGYQYQDLFMNSPEMKPVRTWVEKSSKDTYLSYLIMHPIQTLGEPLNHLRSLLDGSNVMYSYPRNPLSPLPAWVTTLTKLLYPHGWIMLVLFIFAMSTGCVVNWKNDHQIPIWAVIAVMFIGILPLMYVTWYGEPMEIERHSIELSAQLRLGGWLAFIYLLDEALEKHLIETFLQKLTSRMKTGTFKTKKNEV